jgi:RNA polymerase sigma-70 factor (ECF subfamily)
MQQAMLLYAPYADNELVQKVKSGKSACFEVLMRRHTPALYRMGRAYGFDSADAEDLVKDAHLTAHLQLELFDAKSTYRAWLSQIMIEKCNNRVQLVGASGSPAPAESDSELAMSAKAGPQDDGVGHDVESLPMPLRSVYVLREVEGFSDAETASLLQTSEASVKSKIRSAKSSLKSSLRRRFFHTDVYPCRSEACDRIVSSVLRRI